MAHVPWQTAKFTRDLELPELAQHLHNLAPSGTSHWPFPSKRMNSGLFAARMGCDLRVATSKLSRNLRISAQFQTGQISPEGNPEFISEKCNKF